jgi:streptogramin lyase
MPVDVRELMRRAAGEPVTALDTDAVLRRASRLRRRWLATVTAAVAFVAIGLTVGLVARLDSESAPRVATEPHARARVGTIKLFPRPTPSSGGFTKIARGPDRSLWFTPSGGQPRLARITLDGTISEIPIPSGALGVVSGKDGKVYFGQPGGLARITPATNRLEFFPLPEPETRPMDLTVAPDGDIWITQVGSSLWRFSPRPATFQRVPLPDGVQGGPAITSDPRGNIWVGDGNGRILRVDRSGKVDVLPVPGQGVGFGITAGPDGDIWFTGFNAVITRITATGQTSQYIVPNAGQPSLVGIATGADGNLWFANFDTKTIGRISPRGKITQYPINPSDQIPGFVAPGADGNVWFTTQNSIGRITTGAAQTAKRH